MLVLTRRVEESLVIGDSIVVTILGIEGDKVKLGIQAPREIPILREEVFLAMKDQEKLEMALATGPEPDSFQSLRELLAAEAKPDEAAGEDQPKPAEPPDPQQP